MIEIEITILLLFFSLVVLQTIVGIGVLVLGTPILLILHYDIVQAISILLPISILTSLINLFYFKFIEKISILDLGANIKKSFFTICIPAIFFGLILLKYFQNEINFKILVSIFILISLIIKKYYDNYLLTLSSINSKIMLFGIGLVHGLTNSGGTLLSIFILNISKNLKFKTRYNLTFFYFFLALLQYFIFIIFFQTLVFFDTLIYLILIIFIGIIVGNFLVGHISEKKFNFFVEILAFISVIFLITGN